MHDLELTERHLTDALERGEFLFHYQPILSLRTGKIDGVEALIRWKKDSGDLVPPGEFIPYAEETGVITKITAGMLPKFLDDLKRIHEVDSNLVSSINISAKDLNQGTFASSFLKLIKKEGVDPSKIKIEITESSALSLSSDCLLQIPELTANGIQLAVDDFGTGHATFEKLKNLPFSTLKIDYIITNGAMSTPDGLTLLDHSINLAHQLNIDSVAEGVENQSTMGYLMGIGCEHIQGYYISKPVDLDSLIKILDQKEVRNVYQHGHIYKAMVDFTDWVRKVYFSIKIARGNNRVVPFEAAESPTGKFLLSITEQNDFESYKQLEILHNKCFEVAKVMLNAKSSGKETLVDELLNDFFKLSGEVSALLQKAYCKECLHGALEEDASKRNP